MPNGTPRPDPRTLFADLVRELKGESAVATQELELPTDPREAFAQIVRNFQPQAVAVPSRQPTIFSELAGGAKEEILSPTTIFRSPGAELDHEEEPFSAARFVGQLVGFGIGIIPFIKGSQIAIRAFGVAKPFANFLGGALGFGLFEAGRGTPDEAFERFAKGTALGVLFEGMFLKKALREFETSQKLATAIRDLGGELVEPGIVEGVNPLLGAVSAALNPRKFKENPEAFWAALKEVKDVNRALDESFSRLARVISWEGRFTLPGIRNPAEFVDRIKRANPKATLDFSFWLNPETGNFKAMVLDTAQPRSYLARIYRKTIVEPEIAFGGSGLPVAMDPENLPNLVKYISADLPEEIGVIVEEVFTMADLARLSNAVATRGTAASASVPELITRLSTDIIPRLVETGRLTVAFNQEDIQRVATLIHEFTHHVFHRRGFANILDRIGAKQFNPFNANERAALISHVQGHGEVFDKLTLPRKLTLKDFFSHKLDDAEFLEGMGISNVEEAVATWTTELKDVTQRIERFWLGSEEKAAAVVAGSLDYYHRPTELLARFAELVLINPAEARAAAPNFYDVFARIVSEESPKLKLLLSRGEPVRLLEWTEAALKSAPPSRGVIQRVFTGTEDVFKITENMKAFFRKHGYVQGEEVSVDGVSYIMDGLAEAPNTFRLRNLLTGELVFEERSQIVSSFISDVIQKRPELRRKILEAIRKPPKWLGVLLEDTRFTDLEGAAGIRRAVIEVEEFAFIQARSGERASDAIVRWADTNFFTNEVLRDVLRNAAGGGSFEPRAGDILASFGLKGILVREEPGVFTALVADRSAIRLGDDVLNTGLVGDIGGRVGDQWITIDVETAFRSLLAEAGATEAQMPYFMQRVRNDVINKDLLAMLDDDVASMLRRAEVQVNRPLVRNAVATPEGVARLSRMELDVVQNADGTWSVVNRRTGLAEVTVQTEETAIRIYQQASDMTSTGIYSPSSADLLRGDAYSGASFKAAGDAGGSLESNLIQSTRLADPPPQVTESPTFIQRILDAVTNLAPWFSSLEIFSKQVERQLGIPAYRNLFLPAQRAFQRVLFEFERTPRAFLDGRTYTQQLKLIQELQRKVGRRRSPVVRGMIEVMSREEIEAGGLSTIGEPVAQSILKIARQFEKLGVNRDIARLTAQRQLIVNALKNKEQFVSRTLPPLVNRRDLDPIMRETVQRLRTMADEIPDTFEGVAKAMGLSDSERTALRVIDDILTGARPGVGPQDLFIMSRWGDAAALKKGFKTARAQYIADQGMNEIEIKLASEVQRMMFTGFGDLLTGSRMISGYWGHLRKWVDAGFRPRLRGDLLREMLPQDFMEWAEMRLRSGELDVYETDMVLLAYKISRALLMREHFDPHISGFKQILGTLRATDRRSYRIMSEYLDELIGRPHVSFRRLNEAVARSMEIMGFRAPFRTAERMINNMTALAYGASIPFRLSLILRNYYQMVQMIPARIGPRWFEKGLEQALTKEGFEEAVRAGAIPLGITPVFASTEALGVEVLRGANLRLRRLFEKGFDWYRKADDYGRAVAFHGQKQRLRHFYDQYAKGQIDYATFKARAKVNTYDSTDIALFDDLMSASKTEEAFDHLGVQLSREAHFRYGAANHPAGWGSVQGRLFGQFGTWPVQYKDFLIQGFTRGSVKDRTEFLATHIGVNMGLVAGGAAVGMNLWSWASMPSLNYTGGPFVDLSIDFIRAWNGSPAERAMAKRSIMMQFPTLEDPRSIFVPGSYFIGDINSVLRRGEFDEKSLLEAGGFRFFEPEEKSGFEWLWDF